MSAKIGHWAFLIGVALVIIAGFVPGLDTIKVVWTLVLLGLIVGILNVTAKETHEFLLASVALILAASAAGEMVELGRTMSVILRNIVLFVFPAALIVSLKIIWRLAEEA